MEIHLGKLLQRFICQLHVNVLPFWYLLTYLYGEITGPNGQQLQVYEKLPVVNFTKTESMIPRVEDKTDLALPEVLFDNSWKCSQDLSLIHI